MKLNKRNALIGLLFVSPWIIGFLIFTAFPLFYSLYLSFQKVQITTESIRTTFVKFENYRYAFGVDVVFGGYLIKFLKELAVAVPIIIVFSLIIALLLNKKIRFRGLFRTIFFLPVIITSGPVINEIIEQGGAIIPGLEQLEYTLSVNPNSFINGILLYLINNLIIILWFSGVPILIFLAALQKVDRQIYEAAMVDGASGWESFWKITLPSLHPMIIVNVIYTIVNLSVFSLNPVINHIQKNMFKVDTGFGYASALAWIFFIVISLVLLIVVGAMTIRGKRKYS